MMATLETIAELVLAGSGAFWGLAIAALVGFGLSRVERGSPPTLEEAEAEYLAPGRARLPERSDHFQASQQRVVG